jgi:hypothetical protein
MSNNPFDQFDASDKPADTEKPFDQFDSHPSEEKLASMQPKDGAIGDSIGNQLHEMGSGLYHGVVGGYKGIGALVTGKGVDSAADAVNDETAKTYQAPDSALKSAMGSKYNPLNYAQNAADYAADKSADWGASPGVSTAIKSLPTALAAITGTAGLVRNPKLSMGLKPKVNPAAEAEASAVGSQGAHQSMGAAVAAPDISVADPHLKTAIEQTDSPHPIALERHLDTAQLPLPEGSTPLRLRKGQALGDDQQISDEKNLRADQDTQGLLTDSINDQNGKLGASMTEIRRRATPDIVQRNNTEHDQVAINAIKKQDNATVTDIREKYKALADANGGDMPIDTAATLGDINTRLKKTALRKTAENHPVISEIMESMQSGEPIDFDTFEHWRTNLADVQRKPGSESVAAGIVHNALNNMPLTPEAEPLRALADTARSAAKARFDTIKQNPAYKAAINDNVPKVKGLHDLTEDSPLAGNFLDRFALGDSGNASPAYIKRLKDAVPDPELHRAMEASTLNKLREASGIDMYGNGNFRNAQYRNALGSIEDKSGLLLSPESQEGTQRLARVSGYVNDEGKGSATNRSNTALTLQRFGAHAAESPSIKGQVLEGAADLAAGHALGPLGVVGSVAKGIGKSMFKSAKEAKAAQALKDAKLKFAQDAVKPGAGLDHQPPATPVARATGGRAGPSDDELVERLMRKWKHAKRGEDASTKPLLTVPDATIIHALKVSGAGI